VGVGGGRMTRTQDWGRSAAVGIGECADVKAAYSGKVWNRRVPCALMSKERTFLAATVPALTAAAES